jgi:predicted HTH domain antitoxin
VLGAKQYKLEKAIKHYQEGKTSIGNAAKEAGISLWEMMDELKDRNIPNQLSEEEFKEGLKNLEKAWK